MNSKPRVLWIEDSATYELADVLGMVYSTDKYLLKLAQDASTATDWLTTMDFSAVIVDIRLPPGHHRYWQDLYKKAGRDKITAQLGLCLLQWLLQPNGKMREEIRVNPPNIPPSKIAVFTIESHAYIGNEINNLGISVFVEKATTTPRTKLLEIIQQLLYSY